MEGRLGDTQEVLPQSKIMIKKKKVLNVLREKEGGRGRVVPSDAENKERGGSRAQMGAGDPPQSTVHGDPLSWTGCLPPKMCLMVLLVGSTPQPTLACAEGKLVGPGFKSHLLFCQSCDLNPRAYPLHFGWLPCDRDRH